jgi:Protein of unknown function (DUF2510)
VSTPAGWYTQPDGRQRYWDGELWTDHFAPGVAPAATSRTVTLGGRKVSRAQLFGWVGLALVFLIGALTSGVSGAAIWSGLFALVVALVALARGRVGWARLGNRAAGGIALGAALVLLTIGALAAPPSISPAGVSTTTISDAQTAADDAAATAATQAANNAAAATAATQAANDAAAATAATQAADKAAAAAATQAANDAAAAAAPPPAPAPAPAPAPVAPGGAATALCNDGTLSFAAHHQGACSRHGGVAVFYK